MTHSAEKFLVADLQGLTLSDEERSRLSHTALAGIILFARNFESRRQLIALIDDIRSVNPELLIMADQEGGRVQRFRGDGFTLVPPMGVLGQLYLTEPDAALALTREIGWLLASELGACGIDLGLAPVLDLDRGISRVVGDRSFGACPEAVSALGVAYVAGLHEGGMSAVGKHFPGHGGVGADSHTALPVDNRSAAEINDDLKPFEDLVKAGLDAVMPAHIRFPAVDSQAAGFSQQWLNNILRQRIGFQGVVFSDCLSMAGASIGGDIVARTEKALSAGCDLALICNNPQDVVHLLACLDSGQMVVPGNGEERAARIENMRSKCSVSWDELFVSERRERVLEWITALVERA